MTLLPELGPASRKGAFMRFQFFVDWVDVICQGSFFAKPFPANIARVFLLFLVNEANVLFPVAFFRERLAAYVAFEWPSSEMDRFVMFPRHRSLGESLFALSVSTRPRAKLVVYNLNMLVQIGILTKALLTELACQPSWGFFFPNLRLSHHNVPVSGVAHSLGIGTIQQKRNSCFGGERHNEANEGKRGTSFLREIKLSTAFQEWAPTTISLEISVFRFMASWFMDGF